MELPTIYFQELCLLLNYGYVGKKNKRNIPIVNKQQMVDILLDPKTKLTPLQTQNVNTYLKNKNIVIKALRDEKTNRQYNQFRCELGIRTT